MLGRRYQQVNAPADGRPNQTFVRYDFSRLALTLAGKPAQPGIRGLRLRNVSATVLSRFPSSKMGGGA
jgi:hypothetical protein